MVVGEARGLTLRPPSDSNYLLDITPDPLLDGRWIQACGDEHGIRKGVDAVRGILDELRSRFGRKAEAQFCAQLGEHVTHVDPACHRTTFAGPGLRLQAVPRALARQARELVAERSAGAEVGRSCTPTHRRLDMLDRVADGHPVQFS